MSLPEKVQEAYERSVDFLRQRKSIYMRAFSRPEYVDTVEAAYERVFTGTTAGQMVLRDLAQFCRALETVYDPDLRRTDILIGRNEVFKRIQQHLNLTPSELYAIHGDRRIRLLKLQEETEE